MISTTITCDVCGVAKKESNHWFEILAGEAFHAAKLDSVYGRTGKSALGPVKQVCGEQCATRLILRWMRTGTLEEVPPKEAT